MKMSTEIKYYARISTKQSKRDLLNDTIIYSGLLDNVPIGYRYLIEQYPDDICRKYCNIINSSECKQQKEKIS